MNTNKYEFDSTDEMLKLSDFHFDQNVPVQRPEAQALEAQGPENQAPEDQAPEALQIAAHGLVMPSTAQLQDKGKSSADINFDQNMLSHINFDQNHPDQVPSVGTSLEDLAQYYVSKINAPEEMSMLSYFGFDQNNPAQALEAEVPSSAGARHSYNLTELDGAPVNDNTRISMPGESRHSYSLPLDTRSGDGPVVTGAPYNLTELEKFMLSYFDSDQNNPAQALETEVPSSAGARQRYNLTELDGALVNDKSDPRLSSGAGPSNTRMSMPGESRHSYSLPLDTRSGDGPVVTEGSDDRSQAFAQLLMVGMSPADAQKAMMDKTLNKIALSDPKFVKRTLANRQSAARSKKRKAEKQAELETEVKTLQTQRDDLVDDQALCLKDVDALTHENTQLRSNLEVIQQQNLILDSWTDNLRMAVNCLRIKAGLVDPNSGPPGMMMPFGVRHNYFAPNSGPPGMMMPFRVPRNNFALNPPQAAQTHARMQQQQQLGLVQPSRTNVALNSGPPGMTMPFRVPHNNVALNPYQQAAQAHARMQQQQQPRLVPPRRMLMLLEGADAAGNDAGGGDDAPGQGP